MEVHGHIPVLAQQVMDLLAPQPGETAVDCTVGRGGHAEALLQAVGETGVVIGCELDPTSLEYARQRLRPAGGRFYPVGESFVRAPAIVRELGCLADVVLADLGFSSAQMVDPSRGFSFGQDGPLDMRFDPTAPMSAADVLACASEEELADLIFNYGEDPLARRIARKLVQIRQTEPIQTTAQLARLVREAYGRRAHSSRLHPATRTFMALRIAVNDELGALRGLLEQVRIGCERIAQGGWLSPTARVGIISFHSLEDRMVKQAFAELCRRDLATRLTRKPAIATPVEVSANSRARSAKLRVIRVGLQQGR